MLAGGVGAQADVRSVGVGILEAELAEAQKGGEQSMDDILASIRKIISDEPTSGPDLSGDLDSTTDRVELQSSGNSRSFGCCFW